jgi:hypothetical protein
MRRAFAASLIVLALVVAACGSNPTPVPPTPTPEPPVVTTPAPTVAPTVAPSPTISAATFAKKYAKISATLTAAAKTFQAELAKARSEKAVKAAWTKYLAAYRSSIKLLKAVDWPEAARADIVALLDAEDQLVVLLNKAAAHPATVQANQSKILKLEKTIQSLAKKVKDELALP